MKSIRTNPTVHAVEGDERTLEKLLAAGEVRSALILKGDYTPAERELARKAWEAGLAQRGNEYACAHDHRWFMADDTEPRRCPVCGTITFKQRGNQS